MGSFLGNISKSFSSGIGGVGASILGSAIGSKVLDQGGVTKRSLREGHEADTTSYKNRDTYDWEKAQERGLTPQEFYGSSAAGGSASSGGAQVLGNSQTQSKLAAQRIGAEAASKSADREIQMRGQDTQIEAAKIAAGANKYSTDVKDRAALRQLTFNKQQYQNVTLPQAAAQLNKTIQETEKVINDVATSNPKFVRMIKIMTMGTDNTLGLAIQNELGIDVSDVKQMQNLSAEQRQKLIGGLLAAKSTLASEFGGAGKTVSDFLDTIAGGIRSTGTAISDAFKPGIKPSTPSLGNSGRGRGYH